MDVQITDEQETRWERGSFKPIHSPWPNLSKDMQWIRNGDENYIKHMINALWCESKGKKDYILRMGRMKTFDLDV